MTRILGIVSGKGGTGKTTLAANIGSVLASKYNKDVILVDCNITTSHLGMYLGMYYYPISLNQVLRGDVNIDKAIYEYSIPGLRVIPASLSLDEMKGVEVSELKSSIKDLFGKADLVILDGAPGFGREAIATIKASDEIIYVMNPFVPSMMDIVKCKQLADRFNVKSLGVVVNMTNEGRHELTDYEIEQLTEMPVLSRIPRDKEVLKSLANKIPVTDLNKGAKASKVIDQLAANLIGAEYRSPGLFSRLFKKRSPAMDFKFKTQKI